MSSVGRAEKNNQRGTIMHLVADRFAPPIVGHFHQTTVQKRFGAHLNVHNLHLEGQCTRRDRWTDWGSGGTSDVQVVGTTVTTAGTYGTVDVGALVAQSTDDWMGFHRSGHLF